MNDPLVWLAALTLLVSAVTAIDLIRGLAGVVRLSDCPVLPRGEAPHVTVVIPARNEELNLEAGLSSLLAQDYPSFDVIAVDDRSSDRTGHILDRMEQAHTRLRALHVSELPPAWLGKNHALHLGSTQTDGPLILFTDADVVMDPSVLARAVGHLQRAHLAHLTVWPAFRVPGWLAELTVGFSLLGLLALLKPWKAKQPNSRRHFGVGAFNLVVAGAYREAGGHAAIALRPDDDLMLGKLMKTRGHRQEALDGHALMSVEWYRDLGEMVKGLRKNAFAIVNYNVGAALLMGAALFAVDVWPTVALAFTSGTAFWLNASVWIVGTLTCLSVGGSYGMHRRLAPLYPLAALVMLYILARSVGATLWHGEIEWRGTSYPLDALRGNRV